MTEEKRQQIRDYLALAQQLGGEELKQKAWELLPYKDRFEFNWEHTTI